MAIHSIGVDLIEIERIANLIERYGDKFVSRIFTEPEIEYCSRKKDRGSYAARFAVKEAVFKAAGTGLGKEMTWRDVEVVNNALGKPEVRVYGKTAELLAGRKIHLSISHSKDASIAMVVVE